MPKKILILGGAIAQIPAIIYAKEKGYHVITCDYLPENPGHKLSDEYYNVSTTDMESICALAQELKIDGIVAYASDPAAPTAAYVSEKMKLSANPFNAIDILAKKTLFRKFLQDHDFNSPKSIEIFNVEQAYQKSKGLNFPVMVKPDDSSGSKGVTKVSDPIQLGEALDYAMKFSRNKKCIIEEFVNRVGPQIGGDAFVFDGKVVFMHLGDQYVNKKCNPFVPTGMLFPSGISELLKSQIQEQIQRVIDILVIRYCAINIEVMLDSFNKIYLMELGPRNGGNFMPQIINYATGVDMVRATIDVSVGEKYNEPEPIYTNNSYAYYAIHSEVDGVLESIEISEQITDFIIEKHIYMKDGEQVVKFNGSNATLGIILFKFTSYEKGVEILNDISNYIVVKLK